MKAFWVLVLIVFLGSGCGGALNSKEKGEVPKEFCGQSTGGDCQSDADCIAGGCSSQVCSSKSEGPIITTCEWRECYQSELFGVQCGCVENKCQWHK